MGLALIRQMDDSVDLVIPDVVMPGTIEIDTGQCLVRQEGVEVPLTDTEYRIL